MQTPLLSFLSLSFAMRVLIAPSWNLCLTQYCIRSNPDYSHFYWAFLADELNALTFLQFSFVIRKGLRELAVFWFLLTVVSSKETLQGISTVRPASELLRANSSLFFSFRWQSFALLKLRKGYRILTCFIFSLLLGLESVCHSPLLKS
jgi:hypothetical protein